MVQKLAKRIKTLKEPLIEFCYEYEYDNIVEYVGLAESEVNLKLSVLRKIRDGKVRSGYAHYMEDFGDALKSYLQGAHDCLDHGLSTARSKGMGGRQRVPKEDIIKYESILKDLLNNMHYLYSLALEVTKLNREKLLPELKRECKLNYEFVAIEDNSVRTAVEKMIKLLIEIEQSIA